MKKIAAVIGLFIFTIFMLAQDLRSQDRMKWGIILLAVILIVGTILDLYFSLAVRTFYLTMLHYPDIVTPPPPPAVEKPKAKGRAEKYQTPAKDQNVT